MFIRIHIRSLSVAMALFAGVVGLVFFLFFRSHPPFIITAPPGVIKSVPEERGGIHIPKNLKIHDALVGKAASRAPKKDRVILDSFSNEKAAQKSILRFLSLAPDIFQKESPFIEEMNDRYFVVAELSARNQQVVCQLMEEKSGERCNFEIMEEE